LSARISTPAPIIKIAIQSLGPGRSWRKNTAKTETSNTQSLSTGATFEAGPTFGNWSIDLRMVLTQNSKSADQVGAN